jgi:uncharacterized membrane protein
MDFLKKKVSISTIVILILAIPALLPLLRPGFFSIHDEAQHIVDIYEMYRSFEVGGFPARWAPDLTFGFGHPYFNFYYHLPFYIGAFLMSLGLTITASFKGVMLVAILSAIFGFYFFAKRYVSSLAAIISATLYLYTPYFAVDLYVRGALGELAVLAIAPWVLFFLSKLADNPNKLNIGLASIIIGLLGISHNVLNIFAFPIFFAYGVFLSTTNNRKNLKIKLLSLITVFILGAALSSYYWLPALFERQYISPYQQFNLNDHFPFIKQLIIPSWGYGVSHWGPYDDMSFQIGVVNLIFVVLALLTIKVNNYKKPTIFFLGLFFILFILMNSRTYFLWDLHPILHFIQFPWRLLIFTTISTSILAGLVMEIILNHFSKSKKIIVVLLVCSVIILVNIWYFKPSEYSNILDQEYLKRYFANRVIGGQSAGLSREYLNFSEDFLPPTNWQKMRPTDLPRAVLESSPAAKITILENKLGIRAQIEATSPTTIILNKTYFPGWQAYISKGKINTYPFGKLGIIAVDVPTGKNEVLIKFENTSVRKIANYLSLFSFLTVLIFFVISSTIKIRHD